MTFHAKNLLRSFVNRTWVPMSCQSAFKISTRIWPTAWWLTLKVGLQKLQLYLKYLQQSLRRSQRKQSEKPLDGSTSSILYALMCLCSPGSSESVEQVMDQVEKYIMTRLYKSVFCPETTDDERKDLATQNRIRWFFLDWTTQHSLMFLEYNILCHIVIFVDFPGFGIRFCANMGFLCVSCVCAWWIESLSAQRLPLIFIRLWKLQSECFLSLCSWLHNSHF